MKKRIALAILSLHALASPAFSDKINYGYFIYEHDEKKYERPKITDWRRISLEYQFSDDRLKFIAYDLDEKSYCVYDWQNQEKVPNKLADFLNESKLEIEMCDIKNRIIDAHSGNDDQWAHYIILWNEDFSKIEKYKLKDFFENADRVVTHRFFRNRLCSKRKGRAGFHFSGREKKGECDLYERLVLI